MAIVVPPTPGFGQLFGAGFGTGLQEAVSRRIHQAEQGRLAQSLESFGLQPQEAQFFAQNPQLLQPFIERGGFVEQKKPAMETPAEQEHIMAAQQAFEKDPKFRKFVEGQEQYQTLMKQLQQARPSRLGMLQAVQQPLPEKKEEAKALVPAKKPLEKKIEEKPSVLEILGRPSPREQRLEEYRARKLGLEEERLSHADQARVDKETKPYYDQITKESRGAQENDKRLDQMEQLIQSGKLSNPAFVSSLKTLTKGIFGLGINLEHLAGPETEQFEKLSSDFLRNARDIFGARLTNYDVESFLKTIPNALQSNAAKQALITNLRTYNEAARLRKIAMDQIIKQNHGKRPADLDSLVEEKVSPLLDEFAEELKKNIREVPKEEPFGISLLKGATRLFI